MYLLEINCCSPSQIALLLTFNQIFGVPGDFNLALLDKIYEVDNLRWVGNTNELNAGYAADGYSRINGLGALITTFGVGELSTLNAVAGAYAEHVGLIHIVGVPATSSQQKHLLLHHTLGTGDFNVFHRMSQGISEKVIILTNGEHLTDKIDLAIKTAKIEQKPVYLAIPTNIGEFKVPKAALDTPIDFSFADNEPQAEQEVLDLVYEEIKKSKRPIILVDACAKRHGSVEEVLKFVRRTGFPVFTTPMGKSVVDESYERYGGVYVGSLSSPEVKNVVENADLVLSIGALLSDFNTGSFTYQYKTTNIIEFHSSWIQYRRATFQDVRMAPVLHKLSEILKDDVLVKEDVVLPKLLREPTEPSDDSEITHKYLWPRISRFLNPGDIIVTETGTSSFGVTNIVFPKDVIGISQVLWGSIGYAVGAALGAAVAAEEIDKSRRVILFVGDGSLQMTVAAISSMIRWKLNLYLFVLNNNGYTVERLIHGPEAQYNDIQPWRHLELLSFFGAEKEHSESIRVSTKKELDTIFKDKEFNTPNKIRLIELMLPEMDAPEALVEQGKLTSKTNSS